MNSFTVIAMGMVNRDKEQMVFDWDKAARIIKERSPESAAAGLRDDWLYTSGIIYRNGQPNTTGYAYLASTWAVPELYIDGEMIPCYRMQSEVPNWGAETMWPRSALKILEE